MPAERPCPFCSIPPDRVVASGDLVFAVRDVFPVSEGHTLVIPRRHFASYFDATDAEHLAIAHAVRDARVDLDARYGPAGYNIGINVGSAAGQTVFHLHVHVIPRYEGDIPDPTGGVRLVIPERGNYRR